MVVVLTILKLFIPISHSQIIGKNLIKSRHKKASLNPKIWAFFVMHFVDNYFQIKYI